MKSEQRGFTLIELLVVIAIIGILSAVILAALGAARGRARIASAQETMHSIQVAAAICLADNLAVNIPGMNNNGSSFAVCTGNPATYTALPAGWIYCDDSAPAAGAGNSDPGAGALVCNNSALNTQFAQVDGFSFNIAAYSSTDLRLVQCTEISCTTVAAQ